MLVSLEKLNSILNQEVIFSNTCPYCGSDDVYDIDENARGCGYCGHDWERPEPPNLSLVVTYIPSIDLYKIHADVQDEILVLDSWFGRSPTDEEVLALAKEKGLKFEQNRTTIVRYIDD